MNDTDTAARPPRLPWNKGKITGPKPPLRPGHVWAIRAKLHLEKRTRDLAMFNLAIPSIRNKVRVRYALLDEIVGTAE
jgi:hypothetical protein